jgi:2-phosphoglycerate kinase
VSQDQRVRDAVLESLMTDSSANVRSAAIGLLQPVQSDSSVRQVLRTVSTQDENPYIRTASYQALQGAGDIQ